MIANDEYDVYEEHLMQFASEPELHHWFTELATDVDDRREAAALGWTVQKLRRERRRIFRIEATKAKAWAHGAVRHAADQVRRGLATMVKDAKAAEAAAAKALRHDGR